MLEMRLAKNYEPNQYEANVYALWERSNAFAPKNRGGDGAYSIVMPPPNANANLHIGYALTAALEDITARYQRMRGKATLLLPGADHAGFETQSVYEKHLAKEGRSRFDFSREELYARIWDFVAENRTGFEAQIRAMGVSASWDHYTFTLDEKIVSRAYETFKKMWDEGLIYRGERLVNYCTHHGTGFADIEVEYQEVNGHIWSIRYPLVDGSGEVVVATTRPETMLGDVAVAVNPDDERYKSLVGKSVKLPLTNREIPVISDSFVDTNFGTGAVKITPAHDPNDYEVAGRHDLPMITVIGHDGLMNHNAPEAYRGLTVKEARKQVVNNLEGQGLLTEVKEHVHNVGHCYKCGTVIEPLLMKQWFVDMQPLAKPAIQALKEDKITFYPSTKKEQLIRYLEGLRDWNISRQIAWGIPIPAFQNVDDPDDWIFDTRVNEAIVEIEGKKYHRDPDVLDTWFSSSSWPYATLGDSNSDDFKQFYPTSLMETGGEILYPWVSRMIMLGLYTAGDIPFKEVYIHGYVMAEDGAKMSKSIGNVVDPLPVIKQYGSDALRMGIISGRSPAVNRGYDPRRIEEARNFCNKLWNIARYIESQSADAEKTPEKTIADEWILGQVAHSVKTIEDHLSAYRFSEAYETLYHLVWDDVADWYIEASKAALNYKVLEEVLELVLKLAHPFAPFLTETIWQTLHEDEESLLITSSWPKAPGFSAEKANEFEKIKALVSEIRQIKSLLKVHKTKLLFADSQVAADNSELIARLGSLGSVGETSAGKGLPLSQTSGKYWLDIDLETAKDLVKRLSAQKDAIKQQIGLIEKRLSNKNYVEKAPESLVNDSKAQLESLKIEQESTQKQLDQLSKI